MVPLQNLTVMKNPYLDWDKLEWHFQQFKIASEYLLELKPVDLAHLLLYVGYYRGKYAVPLNEWLMANRGSKIEDYPIVFDPELERLEGAVKAEQQRRKGESVTPGQMEPTDENPLRPFFIGDDEFLIAITAAIECGILDNERRWITLGFKTWIATIFYWAAVKSKLAKAKKRNLFAPAMAKQFNIDGGRMGKMAIKTDDDLLEYLDNHPDDRQLYGDLFKKMKSGKNGNPLFPV